MEVRNKIKEGNFGLPWRQTGRATPSLRYLQKQDKEIEINNNKGYFSGVCQNNLPEDFPNSK